MKAIVVGAILPETCVVSKTTPSEFKRNTDAQQQEPPSIKPGSSTYSVPFVFGRPVAPEKNQQFYVLRVK